MNGPLLMLSQCRTRPRVKAFLRTANPSRRTP